ncbi:MAG TPA: AraC family transcriptional regulator [Vicinamibacterales bacterium]|nr:AraC family transcriptional regulator [Vicinamibacterales bacterium]
MADNDVRAILFETEVATVGRWRCPVGHPLFHDSGPARRYLFCFPRTSVWIQHDGGTPFVADPNTVTYYNQGQIYRRQELSARGDRGDWFGVAPQVIADVLADWDPSARDRQDRPFTFSHGPCDAATYLLQRAVFEHVTREPCPDTLFVEERVLQILSRTASLAYAMTRTERIAPRRRRARDLAEAARAVVASRFDEPLSLPIIARLVDTSVFHLARVFRGVTGTTLHAYRNQLRLRAALERVADPGSDLLSVAIDLGYSSHSHFSEAFRRTFHVTPSALRGRFAPAT